MVIKICISWIHTARRKEQLDDILPRELYVFIHSQKKKGGLGGLGRGGLRRRVGLEGGRELGMGSSSDLIYN